MSAPFLAVDGVTKHFRPRLTWGDRLAARLGSSVETRPVQAVTAVSLAVRRGETLGLVGESGCGKSTLGRLVAGIATPDDGTIRLDGAPVRRAGAKTTTRVQTVFQDPFSSLDPRMRIGDTILEGPRAHRLVPDGEAPRAFVGRWLATVGLDPAAADRFPHQFSGGQRQRIAIARALAMGPDLLVCDEPVASLDVSIQAQIVNLFLDLRTRLDLTILFISHDLGVVRHLCHRVAIMYLGRVVEIGPADQVYAAPAHPYTRALLDAVPRLGPAGAAFRPIDGEPPSPLAPPPGCAFHPRCPVAVAACRSERPRFRPVAPDRSAACLLAGHADAADTALRG